MSARVGTSFRWIYSYHCLFLRARAHKNGLSWTDLASSAGLDPSLANVSNEKIPIDRFFKLVRLFVETTGNDGEIIDFAQSLRLGQLSELDYVTVCAPSIRRAMQNWARFVPSRTNAFTISFEETDDFGILTYHYAQDVPEHSQFSYILATLVADRILLMCGETNVAFEVHIDAPPPKVPPLCARRYEDIFRYRQSDLKVIFPADKLNLVPPLSETSLYDIVESAAAKALNSEVEIRHPLFGLRSVIEDRLKEGAPSVEQIAVELGMSGRSLQRFLKEERTSFRELVEETRQVLAEKYLKETDLSLKEIAPMVGFNEVSSFSRSAKKWFGMSARNFREYSRAREDLKP